MDTLKKIMSSKFKWPAVIAVAVVLIGLLVWLGPSQVIDILLGDDTASSGIIVDTSDNCDETQTPEVSLSEDGKYFDKDNVALYIHTYGHLPSNFVKKAEAEAKGWSGGSVEPYCPGCAIGGDYFWNNEGLLPSKSGRTWTECDNDTEGASSRGAKRIVFSNDGLIYYTDDHYESFTLVYGD